MKFKAHEDYDHAAEYVTLVRDCIEGEPTIKRKSTTYLPNPDMLDVSSTASIRRYSRYLAGAEFDGYSSETERSMLGKMATGEIEIDLPERIEYLEENVDGDGTSISGMAEILRKNLLEVKFHILLAEMGNLGDTDTESLSMADLKGLDLKATIKSYNRESFIDWDFRKVNGVQQVSLMIFREVATVRDNLYSKKEITTYLVLGLDAEGHYYQEKYIEGDEGEYSLYKAAVYPQAGGKRISWIPVEIIIDEETQAGRIPKGLGYLYPICAADVDRYMMSANYKEALSFQPTPITKGWKQGDHEIFKALNQRDHFTFGINSPNHLPNDVEFDVISIDQNDEQFIRYFELNTKKIKSLGGKVDGGETLGNKSATEASINSRDRTAVMESITSNVESGLARAVSYCGMFMGLWPADEVESALDQITIKLPREFGKAKMSPEEQAAVRDNVMASLYSKDEALRILVAGGVTISKAEDIIDELDNQGQPPLVLPPIPQSEQSQQEVAQPAEDVKIDETGSAQNKQE